MLILFSNYNISTECHCNFEMLKVKKLFKFNTSAHEIA